MQDFKPPISETKRLEADVIRLIQRLREQDEGSNEGEKVSRDEIILLLNRSLTVLSHWVLQAQLMELDPNNQDRVAVENNLLKREVEILSSKSNSTAVTPPGNPSPIVMSSGSTRMLPKPMITGGTPPVTTPVKRKKLDISQITPRRGEFSPKRGPVLDPIITTPIRKSDGKRRNEPLSPTTHQHEASPQFKLVENKKPHPRMRRTSDNPSRNEYVRVFHLEKEK